jgi:hypothetical protein
VAETHFIALDSDTDSDPDAGSCLTLPLSRAAQFAASAAAAG